MSDEYVFHLKLDPDQDDVDRLRARLVEYNISRTSDESYTRLLLSVNDGEGELAAGLYARMHFSWMFVDLLWVAEELRGLGVGAELLAEAEREARRHGCHSVWLDTFSFQAPEFYKKQGFEVFGELPDYPPGHQRYFLCKKLG